MSILDSIALDKEFATFEDIEKTIKELETVLFYPLQFGYAKTIVAYKKSIKNPLDEKWRYKHVHVQCSHFGKHKSRSAGIRPNQSVYSIKCPFHFRVVFFPLLDKFKLSSCNLEQKNHPILKDHIDLYRRKQKFKENPAAYQFANSALAVGGNATLTRKEMSQTWGNFLKRNDLQNMKQAMTGVSSEVWQSTTEILAKLTSNTENIVNVTSDEKGEIKCIYAQLSEQRRFYQRYGEVLQLDGTHSVTNTPMPLYTLIVKDNYGVGQPVAFFFKREETGATMAIGLKQFCENNDNFITQVFLTDKDSAEISAIKCHFPNSKHRLCHFHALRALPALRVDRRLNETDLSKGLKEEIYREYLCALENDSLGRYFDTFWFNTDWVTTRPIIHRRNLCTLGDNTTSRIERSQMTPTMYLTVNRVHFEFQHIFNAARAPLLATTIFPAHMYCTQWVKLVGNTTTIRLPTTTAPMLTMVPGVTDKARTRRLAR
ncbi:Uncharacterized protein APZ42_031446 [Daphnia magna]|uniref:ZSWIM1/3 RNaseH-like domain-containing protein n=1 Tax=Daphnia magna TaxID=35525 RepID=A0A164MUS0_9CRUS|nr:Uncharacterized protein APZ42_031446 [Daphnia magna]